MKKKKPLTDHELVDALGGVDYVADILGFATGAAVRNWFYRGAMPWYWRQELEKILSKTTEGKSK